VKSWVTDPPTDDETIGFVGSDDYEPRTRLFLVTVSLLDDKGKIYSIDDKDTYEIFNRWRDEGVIDPATLRPPPRPCSGRGSRGGIQHLQ
jgi:hypothetical protein